MLVLSDIKKENKFQTNLKKDVERDFVIWLCEEIVTRAPQAKALYAVASNKM